MNVRDLLKGFVVAVIGAALAWLAAAVNKPGFELGDFLTIDWVVLGKYALTAGLAYLSKNLFSTKDGKFLGSV